MSDADEVLICDFCGAVDGMKIGDQCVCLRCYEKAGSCCREFGADDLWKHREKQEDTKSIS